MVLDFNPDFLDGCFGEAEMDTAGASGRTEAPLWAEDALRRAPAASREPIGLEFPVLKTQLPLTLDGTHEQLSGLTQMA